MKQIENIIFDLGDVFINIDPDLTYQAFATLAGLPKETLEKRFDELEVFDRYEKGMLNEAEFITFLIRELNLKVGYETIYQAWNEILLDIPLKRVKLLHKLKEKGYNLYFLSNTSEIHIKEVNAILYRTSGMKDLKDLVIKPYYSYELGMRKPDKRIYEYVLQDAQLTPQKTLFLDDNEDNIKAASTLGIHTILVEKKSDITVYLSEFV